MTRQVFAREAQPRRNLNMFETHNDKALVAFSTSPFVIDHSLVSRMACFVRASVLHPLARRSKIDDTWPRDKHDERSNTPCTV